MGNYRFKLSELIPNAWFYKLKDMGKSRKQHQKNSTVSPSPVKKHCTPPTPSTTTARSSPRPVARRSSHHSRPAKTSETPRKSSRLGTHRATVESKSSAPSARSNQLLEFSTTSGGSTATTGTGSFSVSTEFRSDQTLIPDESLNSPYSCVSSKPTETTFTPPRVVDLRPIITKKLNKPTGVRKKSAVSSPASGVRLRLRSPRVSTRKSVSNSGRGGGSSRRSRAVVKASSDPKKDFKESMEEMILENNIRASKDLEELLACYLCLNSDEYHHIIISVFKQLWLDLNLPHQYPK